MPELGKKQSQPREKCVLLATLATFSIAAPYMLILVKKVELQPYQSGTPVLY
jgi:hypothetical protein